MNVTSTYNQFANSDYSASNITDLGKTLVDTINNFLTSLLPNGELWLVLAISLLMAYRIKRQTNGGMISFASYTFVFWGFFAWLGVGR